MDSFERLGLAEPLAKALASFGFAGPTSIQALALPLLLAHRDAFIEAETGTGKTFAYLAPAFQSLFSGIGTRRGSGEPGILVAAPTQELAVQIGREADKLAAAAALPLRTVVLLGGTPLDKQAVRLRERPDLVVGTLGRLGDLISLGKLKLAMLQFLVLDEADRLLAPETQEKALALLKAAPENCVRVLVSATIPERIRKGVRPSLRDAAEPHVEGETVLAGNIEHWCFYCDGRKRLDFVRKLEAAVKPERCLVFLSAASRVELAAERLASVGLPIAAIHGGMEKEDRRVAIERFASGELRYLLTSDLGARGLDIPAVSHVLSLDLPEEPTVYTHRAGRTGRAGATGVSIVLADGVELARASKIAVRGKFVFHCKVMEGGAVLEPTPAEFFARANAAEEERIAARTARSGDNERRRPVKPFQRREGPPEAPRPHVDEATKGEGYYLRKKNVASPEPARDAQSISVGRSASGAADRTTRHGPSDRDRYARRDGNHRYGEHHDGERSGGGRGDDGQRAAPPRPRPNGPRSEKPRTDRQRTDRPPRDVGAAREGRGHRDARAKDPRPPRKPGDAPFRRGGPNGERRGS